MRLLMDSPEPVDFDGEHFHLRRRRRWACGPSATARRRSGWRRTARAAWPWPGAGPTAGCRSPPTPATTPGMLAAVRAAAAGAGRPEDAVTPGLYARVVVAETREAAEAAIDGSLLMRFIALTRPAEAFARPRRRRTRSARARSGSRPSCPRRYGRDEALRLAEAVPAEVVRDTVIYGTPDDVAAAVARVRRRAAPATCSSPT